MVIIRSSPTIVQDLRCEDYGRYELDCKKKNLMYARLVLLCRGKYFKGFKPTIARMVTRLEFRLYTGNVLGLTVQLMHIERQEVCYALVLSCGNA